MDLRSEEREREADSGGVGREAPSSAPAVYTPTTTSLTPAAHLFLPP